MRRSTYQKLMTLDVRDGPELTFAIEMVNGGFVNAV